MKKSNPDTLQEKLSFYFPEKQFIFTDMGRTAFRLILKELNIKDCKIMLPAYICEIFYPILKEFNLTPVFLDINLKTFNINPEEVKKKLSPEVKAILVCHTYGLPAPLREIQQALERLPEKPLIIEDLAHSLGTKYKGQYVGRNRDAVFISLYKQSPCVRGGAVILPQGPNLPEQARLAKTKFSPRDFISLLNYFSVFSFLFRRFGEKQAPKFRRAEKTFQLASLNRVSLNLFELFLEDFERTLQRRIGLALLFQGGLKQLGFEVQEPENNIFTFLSVLVPENLSQQRDRIVKRLKKRRIYCPRIWRNPIIMVPEVQKEYSLNPADFPNTVTAAKRVITLPLQNHFQRKDIERILKALKLVLQEIRA